MKKIHLFLSLWLACCLGAFAQAQPIEISGVVTSSGAPAIEHPVSFFGFSVNGTVVFLGTTFTNPNGFYRFEVGDTLNTFAGVEISSPRCDTTFGNITHEIALTTGDREFRYDFDICDLEDCTAEFAYYPAPNTPLGFQFESFVHSVGRDFQHYWRFGDGTESREPSPFHEFPGPGTYEVCLLVWDSISNCERDFCDSLVIFDGGNNCIAEFGYEQTASGNVHFFNHSEPSFPFGELTFFWSFGDGTVSQERDPIHQYTDTGVYDVCLIIKDNLGCIDTTCVEVRIGNTTGECNAFFQYYIQDDGQVIFFTDSTQFYSAYVWDFGDGTEVRGGPFEDHQYREPGVYLVCLVVEDERLGCRDMYCDTLVIDRSGVCEAWFGYEVDSVSQGVQFLNQSQAATPNAVLNYKWDFGDGNTSEERDPFHIYEHPGDYEVCLVIFDERDSTCFDYVCMNVWVGDIGCRAEFEYAIIQDRVNQVVFEAVIPPTDEALLYFWDFGDGTTGEGERVVHEYEESRRYEVCLTVMTPDSSCRARACQVIVLGNNTCDATFSYTEPASLERLFAANTISDRLNYTWYFEGSDERKFGPVVDHRFPASGLYLVCLTVSDSLACEETYCDSVYIETGIGNCQSNFTYLIEPGNIYRFISSATSSIPGGDLRYSWDFGDGTTSNEKDPIHAFLNAGNYEVCLTVFDGTGCESTFCQNIGGYNVGGNVLANGAPVSNGEVFLIYHDPINQTLTAVDTAAVQQGHYRFTNVGPGTYLVKAALNPSSIFYRDFLPTYLGDKLFWHQAISVVIASSSVQLPSINLLPGANPGGAGFIGGLISEGANKRGIGLENISILLLDADGSEVSHTVSDENGDYSFPDLAWGTYQVIVEIPGKLSNPWMVTIGPDQPEAEGIDFEVGSVNITTDLVNVTFDEDIKLFPNPMVDKLRIQMSMKNYSDVNVSLMNMFGQILVKQGHSLQKGNHDLNIDVKSLPAGVYILSIESNGQIEARRVVKR